MTRAARPTRRTRRLRKAREFGGNRLDTIESSYREQTMADETIAFARQFPPKTQPPVRKHRTGRKSLAIGVHACGVVGMSPADGDRLLAELLDWATQP